jgi:hypothetical protein
MLGAQGLWAGRDLYRATPAVTRDFVFSGLIRRNAPFSRLLRHTRGRGGPILIQMFTGDKEIKKVERWPSLNTSHSHQILRKWKIISKDIIYSIKQCLNFIHTKFQVIEKYTSSCIHFASLTNTCPGSMIGIPLLQQQNPKNYSIFQSY